MTIRAGPWSGNQSGPRFCPWQGRVRQSVLRANWIQMVGVGAASVLPRCGPNTLAARPTGPSALRGNIRGVSQREAEISGVVARLWIYALSAKDRRPVLYTVTCKTALFGLPNSEPVGFAHCHRIPAWIISEFLKWFSLGPKAWPKDLNIHREWSVPCFCFCFFHPSTRETWTTILTLLVFHQTVSFNCKLYFGQHWRVIYYWVIHNFNQTTKLCNTIKVAKLVVFQN